MVESEDAGTRLPYPPSPGGVDRTGGKARAASLPLPSLPLGVRRRTDLRTPRPLPLHKPAQSLQHKPPLRRGTSYLGAERLRDDLPHQLHPPLSLLPELPDLTDGQRSRNGGPRACRRDGRPPEEGGSQHQPRHPDPLDGPYCPRSLHRCGPGVDGSLGLEHQRV